MVGLVRWIVLGLILAPAALPSSPARAAVGDDAAPPVNDNDAAPQATAPFGEEPLEPFVPLRPRTAEDRKTLDVLRDYAAARALEDRRRWSEAIELYEQALEHDPQSVAILRRLTRLCFILGRTPRAIEYAERVLDTEPGDTATLGLIIDYYERKNDPAAAEALLRKALENPKLDRSSPGYLLINRNLGELYASQLDQVEKAAEAFERVVEALDEKQANDLSLADQRRLLGLDEAATYAHFGEVFQQAGRHDLAIRALRRGLVYDPASTVLPRLLAQSLLDDGKPAEALATLESFLKRQPQEREPYELLGKILEALGRGDEFLPRLEAAAEDASKNLALKYLLADHYRAAGQPEKADALYRRILETQPDPQGFGALAASLVRDKKYEELLDLLARAFTKPDTLEAVKPQVEALANDPAATEALLDAALKLQQADPPKLSKESRLILAYIATKAEKLARFVPIQREALRQDPDPQAYRELWLDLFRAQLYDQAAATLEELLKTFPNEKSAQILVALSQSRSLAGQPEAALEAAREALTLAPDDPDAFRLTGFLLGRLGRNDEAIAHYRSALERFPDDDEMFKYAHSGISIIYVNQGDYARGEKELEILLERFPEDPGVNNDLGYLYADQGKDLQRAEAMIRKAIADDPENAAYLDSLGWVLFRQGKVREAVEPLEQAVERLQAEGAGSDATILDHLGDVYFKLRQLDRARDCWQQAEKSAADSVPPDRRLAEIRRKLDSLKGLDPVLLDPPAGDEPNP